MGITYMLLVMLTADVAQNSMGANYHLVTDGVVLVWVIIFWSYTLNWLGYHFAVLQRLLKHIMRKELVTRTKLMSGIRSNGSTDVSRIK